MSDGAPFVTQLRRRPEAIRLADDGESTIAFRVQVPETWDAVRVDAPADTPVATVKARALATLLGDVDPAGYVVKLRGAEVLDEAASLAVSGAVAGSTLLVTSRRRRPVR